MKILSILLQILLEELFCVLTCLKIQKSGWGMFILSTEYKSCMPSKCKFQIWEMTVNICVLGSDPYFWLQQGWIPAGRVVHIINGVLPKLMWTYIQCTLWKKIKWLIRLFFFLINGLNVYLSYFYCQLKGILFQEELPPV